jgi:hypothetical protein
VTRRRGSRRRTNSSGAARSFRRVGARDARTQTRRGVSLRAQSRRGCCGTRAAPRARGRARYLRDPGDPRRARGRALGAPPRVRGELGAGEDQKVGGGGASAARRGRRVGPRRSWRWTPAARSSPASRLWRVSGARGRARRVARRRLCSRGRRLRAPEEIKRARRGARRDRRRGWRASDFAFFRPRSHVVRRSSRDSVRETREASNRDARDVRFHFCDSVRRVGVITIVKSLCTTSRRRPPVPSPSRSSSSSDVRFTFSSWRSR